MKAKVIVQRFALVNDGFDSYRVYENGMIDCWYVECGWMEYSGASHEKIREAGLKALADDQKQVSDDNMPHLLVNKFVPGDRVRNTLSADNDWVRAGDSGVVVEYEHDRYPDGDIEVLVRWDDPVDKSGRNDWWVMESELELAK